MDLSELVDELSRNILRDRSNLVAGPTDRLWDTDTLVRYIDDAHKRFARRSLCLRDGTTPAVTQVKLKLDQKRYVLHERVIAVMSARYDTDTTDLQRINHTTLGGRTAPSDWSNQGWNPTPTLTPGRPTSWWTDEETKVGDYNRVVLLLDRVPSLVEDGKIVFLRVCRLPICDFSLDDLEAVPEIPADHHLDMLDWAAYRALRNDDEDVVRRKAESYKDSFEKLTDELKQEMLRRMHAPLGWDFGQNGFSWTSNAC